MPGMNDSDLRPDSMNPTHTEGESETFLKRAANILIALGEGMDTVTEISKRCNLSTSTTHRILQALTEPHFTFHDSLTRRYYLGPLVTRLNSNPGSTHQYLLFAALDYMVRLRDFAEETTTLDTAIGIRYLHLHAVHSKSSLKVQPEISHPEEIASILPIGASQKMLLSFLNEKDLDFSLKIAARQLTNKNPAVEVDVKKWKNQVIQIRELGYAITRGESIPGGIGISVPVRNYPNPVALTVLGPENRMETKITSIKDELLKCAKQLSNKLLEVLPNKSEK